MTSRRYAAWLLPTSDPTRQALAWEDERGRAAILIPAIEPSFAPIGVRQPWLNLARKAARNAGIKIKGQMAWLIWLDLDSHEATAIHQEIVNHDFVYEPHPERVYVEIPRGQDRRRGQGRKANARSTRIVNARIPTEQADWIKQEGGSAKLAEVVDQAYHARDTK
jgi:hypothetical protein